MTDDEVVAAISARVDSGRGADLPEPYPQEPASAAALAEAEQTIGFPLPPLLHRLYREVANGGFGPFGGVEGVEDGYASEDGMLTDFGGAMWALLDCRTPEGRMLFLDQSTLHPLDLTLSQWFERWLSDDLDMHRLVSAGQS